MALASEGISELDQELNISSMLHQIDMIFSYWNLTSCMHQHHALVSTLKPITLLYEEFFFVTINIAIV